MGDAWLAAQAAQACNPAMGVGTSNFNPLNWLYPNQNALGQPNLLGVPTTSYALPDNYTNQTKTVVETILDYAPQTAFQWVFDVIPFEFHDQLKGQYVFYTFDQQYMGQTPHWGTSDLQEIHGSTREYALIRRGRAVEIEGDLVGTELGILQLKLQEAGIAYNTLWSLREDGLKTLIDATDCVRTDMMITGDVRAVPAQKRLDTEIQMFAILNKSPEGADLLIQLATELIRRRTSGIVNPDTIVLGEGQAVLFNNVPAINPDASEISAQRAATAGTNPYNVSRYLGLIVHQVDWYSQIDQHSQGVSALTQPAEVGEYYSTLPRRALCDIKPGCRTQARTILKYDQTLDRFAPITLQYMLQHSMRFAPDGSLHPAHWTLAQQGDHFFAQFYKANDSAYSVAPVSPDMMLYRTQNGSLAPVALFGQMEDIYASAENTSQIADDILRVIYVTEQDYADAKEKVDMARQFLAEIATEPYNERYFQELIVENMQRRNRANAVIFNGRLTEADADLFAGSRLTDSDVAARRGIYPTIEYRVNNEGTLDLPEFSLENARAEGIRHAAGTATWAGLVSLARWANSPNSAWAVDGQQAYDIIQFFRNLAKRLNEFLPNSRFLDVCLRSPQYTADIGMAGVLFENLVAPPTAPLYLMWDPAVPAVLPQPTTALEGDDPLRINRPREVRGGFGLFLRTPFGMTLPLLEAAGTGEAAAYIRPESPVAMGVPIDNTGEIRNLVRDAMDPLNPEVTRFYPRRGEALYCNPYTAPAMQAAGIRNLDANPNTLIVGGRRAAAPVGAKRARTNEGTARPSGGDSSRLLTHLLGRGVTRAASSAAPIGAYNDGRGLQTAGDPDVPEEEVVQGNRGPQIRLNERATPQQQAAVRAAWDVGLFQRYAFAPSTEAFRNLATNSAVKRWNELYDMHSGSPLLFLTAAVFMNTSVTHKAALSLLNKGVMTPFEFLLVAPSIEHRMSSALVLKRGAGTAIIAYSHQNFMYNQNASNKSLLGHYTLYAKAFVKHPENVGMLRWIAFREAKPETNSNIFNSYEGVFDAEAVMRPGRKWAAAMFSFMVPANEPAFPLALDITGTYHLPNGQAIEARTPHYSTAPYYAGVVWHFVDLVSNAPACLNPTYWQLPNKTNTLCIQGAQKGTMYGDIRNRGHLGYTYDGVGPVRNGQALRMAVEAPPAAEAILYGLV